LNPNRDGLIDDPLKRRSVTFAEFGFADERVKLTDWYIWVRDTGAADITARLSIWKGHA
jgi:hypothetical protein